MEIGEEMMCVRAREGGDGAGNLFSAMMKAQKRW